MNHFKALLATIYGFMLLPFTLLGGAGYLFFTGYTAFAVASIILFIILELAFFGKIQLPTTKDYGSQ